MLLIPINKACREWLFPQGINKMRQLIYSGEMPATNLGTYERPAWYVKESDIRIWQDSKPKNIKHESIQAKDM